MIIPDWTPHPPCVHYINKHKCSKRPRRCFGLMAAKCTRAAEEDYCEYEQYPDLPQSSVISASGVTNEKIRKLKVTLEKLQRQQSSRVMILEDDVKRLPKPMFEVRMWD